MDEKEALAAVNAEGKTLLQKLVDEKWGGVVLVVSHLVAFGLGWFAGR